MKKLFGRKILWVLSAIAIMAVMFVMPLIIKSFSSVDEQDKLVLIYAENHNAEHPATMGAIKFAELVNEETDGRIEVLVYHSGELGVEQEVIDQLVYGGIDFSRVSISQLADKFTRLNVLQMPYLYESREHMWKVLDGDIGDVFLEGYDGSGIRPLSWYDAGARSYYNSTGIIDSIDDVKNMRIRVQNSKLMEDMIKLVGAIPVSSEYEDVYSLLETGFVGGAENNWPSYRASGHYAVARYFTEDEHTRVPELQICSEATWNKLSESDRNIIKECAKLSSKYERNMWAEIEQAARTEVLGKGVVVSDIIDVEKERFKQAMEPLYEQYCDGYMDIIEQIRIIGKSIE